ncbi:MAG TPA: wax ester/triacylglycerol synthase family O-acyltransferase [Candidatus Solibacter sp.]|jgi:diacylglycerol O-acyltransferase|nr:wax ester/triacylglycerol synthase family O-acyltransferase [Candidatus Solibacter sp.]
MRQLTSLDAQFLVMETPRQYGHVSGIAVLDPTTAPGGKLELADVQKLVAERLPLLPPFRWRLAEVPFGLDYPYWIDDPDFDLDFHVRELALPQPGTEQKLTDQVVRIFARPLDRARPLWELYLIHGLQGGRVAILTKIHHAVVDGMSGAEILGVLLDVAPEGREAPPAISNGTTQMPGQLEMLGRGLAGLPRYPLRVMESLPRALPNIEEVAIYDALPGARELSRLARGVRQALRLGGDDVVVEREQVVPPRTSFNGRVSAHRRLAIGRLPLETVKEVKNRYGCTVNDVIVSICAGAVRRWLMAHDELPKERLVAQIPVSVRTAEQMGTFGNRIMLMSAPVFTNEADPVRRLLATHEAMGDMKDRHRAMPAELLQDATNFIPPAVFSRAARLTFALSSNARPNWNFVISNVPGPQFPLYCAGARLEEIYPVSVVTDGMGLNITVMSYLGQLHFGIVADREMMPDVASLIGWLGEELAALAPSVEGAPNGARSPAPRARKTAARARQPRRQATARTGRKTPG